MLILSKLWLEGLRTNSKAAALRSTHPEEAEGEQAAKANVAACSLQSWKDKEIEDQHPFLHAVQKCTCRFCPVHKHIPSIPPILSTHCCLLHSWALMTCSTELWLLSPRAGVLCLLCYQRNVPKVKTKEDVGTFFCYRRGGEVEHGKGREGTLA